MVWKFNQRQLRKYEYLREISHTEELSVSLTNEQMKELADVEPIPVEETIPGITNAKMNLKGSFRGMTILIWVHVITMILLAGNLYLNSLPESTGEGVAFMYMLLVQLIFFSPLWLYTIHSVNNALEVMDKPIRPLYTFVYLLIPGINLIYPSLKLMQMWKASHIDSTRENWKQAAPSLALIINWILLFIFGWLLIQAIAKNFMLSNEDNFIIGIVAIFLLLTIITFMFQLKARQKEKAIHLELLPE